MVKIGSSIMTTTIGIKRKPEVDTVVDVEKANPNATATPSGPTTKRKAGKKKSKKAKKAGKASQAADSGAPTPEKSRSPRSVPGASGSGRVEVVGTGEGV